MADPTWTATSKGSRESSLVPDDRQTFKGGISASETSIASSEPSNPLDSRSSGDGALDKFKSRGSDDGQSETSSHRRRISKLFKGRRKRSHQEDVPPLPDRADDTKWKSRGPEDAVNPPPLFQQSEESFGLHKSVTSSLLTDDSDTENHPVRPGISPRQSHAGYLTLSSPLIASETIDSVEPLDATLVDTDSSTQEASTLQHSDSIDVATDAKRGVSPVGKLRDAFTPTRRSTSPKAGLDTQNSRLGSGSSLGSRLGNRIRGSRILDDTVPLEASPQQIHEGAETQSTPTLPSHARKRIITHIPSTPPNVVDAPTTLITPPTPTDTKPPSPTGSTASAKAGARNINSQSNPSVVVSPSGNMISHRRARSATNPPSRLSNSISAPLTPTLEETKTPGGTAGPPQFSSSFFSSVFSAAQNAANTLSTTIANTAATNKSKIGNQSLVEEKGTGDVGGEEVIGLGNANTSKDNSGSETRRLAVETLGSGNLSLAQFGISDSNNTSPMSSTVNIPMKTDEASAMAEDVAAAQAVSDAYAADKPTATTEQRDRSLTTTSGGAMSPPKQQEVTDSPAAQSIGRQSSIRSRISGGRRRRHRGSSATTGHTIAAAIGVSTSTLAPQAALNGQRLNGTGFAVAPSRRNRDFHSQFKSVPEDDYLIEDYSAALQKEILLHGRLYVSEGHLCFSSNILGWVTNLVISFDEVVSVEKKSTAVVFPNAIVIQTLHARNVFASFLSRDTTYDLIIGIWKISHPNLKSSLNGVTLDGGAGTGDKTEKAESMGSEDGSVQDSDDEVYDEDAEEDEGMGSFTEAGEGSIAGSEHDPVQTETRKASAAVAQAVSGGPIKLGDASEAVIKDAASTQDYPGPTTHAPTDCGDLDQHYDRPLIDTTIPAPLGKIYSLMFGPSSGIFMRKWLTDDQRCTDLQMEDDKKGLREDLKTFNYSYIKPLPGSIGPRQTKCIISMTLEQFDLEKGISVLASTQTPDVPSGGVFLTKTRYCLMWGPANSTRLIMTFTVEWSGKSWLKGPIEKGASDGQLTYSAAIASALRTAVSTNAKGTLKPVGKGGKLRKRSKVNIDDSTPMAPSPETASATKSAQKQGGFLEPVRGVIGDIATDILELIFSMPSIMGILIVLLIYAWFFRSTSSNVLSHGSYGYSPQQAVAYEEIWRTEESELWKWLEDRVALDRVHDAVGGNGYQWRSEKDMRKKLGKGGVAEGMKERQIEEAIRVTEESLKALKGAVRGNRGEHKARSTQE